MFQKCTSGTKTSSETEVGVRVQDIHHQGIHLLHEINTQACTHKDKHKRMDKRRHRIK